VIVALIALAAVGVLLITVLMTSARPRAAPLPDRGSYLARWAQLHGGITPPEGGVTGRWLDLVYWLAGPLARRGLRPDVLTCTGLWAFLCVLPSAYAAGRWPLVGPPFVVLGGVLDGLDGAVAAMTGRATQFGYVLDSVVDRIADAASLLALHALGAPTELAVGAGGAVALLEYTRARAAATGPGDIGIVTPGERPTRLALIAVGLFAAGLFPGHADIAATFAAAAMLAVCGASFLLLLTDLRMRLDRSAG